MATPVKEPKTAVRRPDESLLKRLTRHQLFIPLAALALLVLFNLIADPTFFAVTVKENSLGNPVLSGNIISVLDGWSAAVRFPPTSCRRLWSWPSSPASW